MPTTVTKSIGTSSRDYSTVQAWEDACPANLVTSDQIWRGECYNDSEFVIASPNTCVSFGGITTDSTRYPELTAATGQSFIDHASVASNARKYDASLGVAFGHTGNYGIGVECSGGGVNYVRVSRLQIKGGLNDACVYQESGTDWDWNQCIFSGGNEVRVRGTGTRIRNCLIITERGSTGLRPKYGADVYSCTVVWPSDVSNTGTTGIVSNDSGNIVQNTAVFGFATASSGTFDTTNSKNNATDLASIVGASGNQTSKTYANQFQNTTTGSRDFRPKSGADTIDTGTTDSTNAATDLIGTSRPSGSAYDIGAEEYVSAGGAITLNADQGTVTVTGYAATTRFSVAAAQGTVAVSGQAATASFGMAAAQGSVAVTGQASTVAWLTAAAQGSVSVAGQAATVNWQMAGAQGTVAITGYDATFDGLAGLVMNADTGFITVAGQDASASWSVAAAQGSISVSGQASAVLWGLNADLGTLALVGYDADFDGVTDAPATTTGGKPRKAKGKRRKVLVGERVFWSDQKAAIARAIAELQAERAQARAEKAKAAAPAPVPAVEMTFADIAGLAEAEIKAMQADHDDEDDIECLLMCH